jgi:hypothetical protein
VECDDRHLVNRSHLFFGIGVITRRWLFVLSAASPPAYGLPRILDETLEPLDLRRMSMALDGMIRAHTASRIATTNGCAIGALLVS